MRSAISILLLMVVLCLQAAETRSVNIVKNPEPNYFEKSYRSLKVVRKIEADFGASEFFVMPDSTAIVKNRLFVLDNILVKIFIFDLEGNYIKSFGKIGQGPGEMSQRYMYKKLSASGNLLTVNDTIRKKVIFYNTDGQLVKEVRYPVNTKALIAPSSPDQKEWLAYIPYKKNSPYGLCRMTSSFKIADSLLDFSNVYYLFNKPPIKDEGQEVSFNTKMLDTPMLNNTSTIELPDGTSIIYMHIPSHLYIMKKQQKVRDFRIWPETALKNVKTRLEKDRQNNRYAYNFLLSYLTPDPDNRHFYFSGVSGGENTSLIYKFNKDGKLLYTLKAPVPVFLSSKSDSKFYGLTNEAIYILEEENR